MTTLSGLLPANLQLVNDWINADSKDTTWRLNANFVPSLCNGIHTAENIENKLKGKISSIKELDIQSYNFQDIGGGIILVFALRDCLNEKVLNWLIFLIIHQNIY